MRSDMYRTFARADWAELRANTPLMLTQEDLTALRGINEQVSLEELADIYLPLSRLLNLHVRAARNLNGVTDTFLGRPIGGRLADVKAGRPEVAAPARRVARRAPSGCADLRGAEHHYKDLGLDEARDAGRRIWSEINEVNLVENILPTRERANVVLRKQSDHSIGETALRLL